MTKSKRTQAERHGGDAIWHEARQHEARYMRERGLRHRTEAEKPKLPDWYDERDLTSPPITDKQA